MFQKGMIVSASWVLPECSCDGPRQVLLVAGCLCFPVLTQGLRVFLPCGCPLAGSGHFPYTFGQLEGEKRAKRKHFCFLKAVANVPVARTRPWSHMDARGAGKCSFWLALSGTSSSPWEGEQGLEWSAGHLCPSSSKRDSLT